MNHDKELDEIYAEVPALTCKKKCWRSCGVVPAFMVEAERMARYLDRPIESFALATSDVTVMLWDRAIDDGLAAPIPEDRCPLLRFNECSVYPVRPLICRLYGIVPRMKCQWGCEPERPFGDDQAHELLARVAALTVPPIVHGQRPPKRKRRDQK